MKRSELILFSRSDIPFYLAFGYMPIGSKNTKISFMGKHGHNDAQLYYFNARWYDPETGGFITEDPVKDGLLWYAYCNNNPLRFVDPTGLYIHPLSSYQKQNTGGNTNASLGRAGTYYWYKNKPTDNTVGNFGCLFTAVVNVGNTERNKNGLPSIPASTLSNWNSYFETRDQRKQVFSRLGEVFLGGGKDVLMSESTIETLLHDMTNDNYVVDRIRDSADSPVQDILNEIAQLQEDGIYIIADVGGHFINVTGIEEDKQGNRTLKYYDPYERYNEKVYDFDDIDGFYQIEQRDQYEERNNQDKPEESSSSETTYSWDYY